MPWLGSTPWLGSIWLGSIWLGSTPPYGSDSLGSTPWLGSCWLYGSVCACCSCVGADDVGCAMNAFTPFDGIAKPMPTLPDSPLCEPVLAICEFTPITLPLESSSAPPELPGLIAASV